MFACAEVDSELIHVKQFYMISITQILAFKIEMNSVLNCKKFSYCFGNSNNDEHVWATGRRARPSTFTNETSIHFSVRRSAPVQNLKKRDRRSESISLINKPFQMMRCGCGILAHIFRKFKKTYNTSRSWYQVFVQ